MAAFEYVALDADGKRRSGVISADSARSARKELRLRDLMVLNVNPVSEKQSKVAVRRARLSDKQRVLLVRQLSVLLKSGLLWSRLWPPVPVMKTRLAFKSSAHCACRCGRGSPFV